MKATSSKAVKLHTDRTAALRANLRGREAANPSNLSQAYGLPVADVRGLMRQMGVREDV